MTPALLVQMGKVYNSLKDGMSVVGDWFGVDKPTAETATLRPEDLKPGTQENRGHGAEGLDQVTKPKAAPKGKPKVQSFDDLPDEPPPPEHNLGD
jgi:hypothetical protein